jgi:hypothetical protein
MWHAWAVREAVKMSRHEFRHGISEIPKLEPKLLYKKKQRTYGPYTTFGIQAIYIPHRYASQYEQNV